MNDINHIIDIITSIARIFLLFLLPSILIGALFRRLAHQINSVFPLALSISLLVAPMLIGWFYLCGTLLNDFVIEGLFTWKTALFFSFTSYFVASLLRFIWLKYRKKNKSSTRVEDFKNIIFFVISAPILSYLFGVAYLIFEIMLNQNNPIRF